MSAPLKETVIFVHGLYMTGLEMSLLRRRVARTGFETRQFHYHSVLQPVRANAERLARYITRFDTHTVHLVGHSLGGLVILRMFEQGAKIPPGRVVLMGSPVRGSTAARNMTERHFGWLLGRSGPDGLTEQRAPVWKEQRELGVLIGTAGQGLGLPHPELQAPHDGLVTVAETRLPGATDRVALDVHHTGMLFSAEVVEHVVNFLNVGRFKR